MAAETLDAATVQSYKVSELKFALQARGLSDKGKKAELLSRLLEFLAAQSMPNATTNSEEVGSVPANKDVEESVANERPLPSVEEPPLVNVPTADNSAPPPATVTELSSKVEVPTAVNTASEATSDANTGQSANGHMGNTVVEGEKKKPKKKRGKKKKYNDPVKVIDVTTVDDTAEKSKGKQEVEDPKNNLTIEYVSGNIEITDPTYAEFDEVFNKFRIDTNDSEDTEKKTEKVVADEKITDGMEASDSDSDSDADDDAEKKEKMSKKKLRKLNRLTVAELKQLVEKPDVIEVHDVTASDPKLLVLLKATRNTVPVPRHWLLKRKYLQGKRGIEKPPFDLPDFIKKTGICEMREALTDRDDRMGLKGKQREKARPKMGKMDIDYQKLHDAFFRWQTKPKMTIHGDLYYEGKEFETKSIDKKPGELSDELKVALGMPVEKDAAPIPPPWLLHMQRYGPPPSYPNLKIPGLNAPLPEGGSFGYHPGGWGKPPVDELGRPLYGDVFNASNKQIEAQDAVAAEEMDNGGTWGALESEEEDSSDEEDSEEDSDGDEDADGEKDEETEKDDAGTVTPSGYTSETPSELTSVQTGMETPDALELRKRRQIEDAMDDVGEANTLYKVIPQKESVGGATAGAFLGGGGYDLSGASAAVPVAGGAPVPKKNRKFDGDGVEVTVNPEELANLDQDALKQKYDEIEAQKNANKEDLSDLVAEHTAKQAKKRKAADKKDKSSKKFKF